jgi:leader peptidase (prepilin peptidase)/N-methyltransferase
MLLLLVAVCGNTANLMLARASARQREMGMRLALGAGPWRIIRLLFAENLMLALAGAAVLSAVRWGWRAATGVEGMGLGDVKMLAMIGAFLGWRQVPVVLFLASLSGAVAGVTLIALGRRSLQTKLPFGTFLAVATYVASLMGEGLVAWYLGLYLR